MVKPRTTETGIIKTQLPGNVREVWVPNVHETSTGSSFETMKEAGSPLLRLPRRCLASTISFRGTLSSGGSLPLDARYTQRIKPLTDFDPAPISRWTRGKTQIAQLMGMLADLSWIILSHTHNGETRAVTAPKTRVPRLWHTNPREAY